MTAMAAQLENHPDLSARLESSWRRVTVLERIARGGGATRWYLGRTKAECRRIFTLLGPGSRVTFYFNGPIRVEPLDERVVGEMFEAVGEASEIVICVPAVDEPVFLDAELVAGPIELTEYLMQPQPSGVVWGPYPGVVVPDSITVVLVDSDGVLRPNAH